MYTGVFNVDKSYLISHHFGFNPYVSACDLWLITEWILMPTLLAVFDLVWRRQFEIRAQPIV